MKAFPLLMIGVMLSVSGEFLLKRGMNRVGFLSMQPGEIVQGLTRTFTTPEILAGFGLVFGGSIFWLAVLSRADLSWAYPLLSVGYVIGVIGGWVLLGEQFSLQRLAGVLIISSGVIVVSRS